MKWQPIESAPKDRYVLLLLSGNFVSIGKWDDDRYASKPRPYWETERGQLMGKIWYRSHPPTAWCDQMLIEEMDD